MLLSIPGEPNVHKTYGFRVPAQDKQYRSTSTNQVDPRPLTFYFRAPAILRSHSPFKKGLVDSQALTSPCHNIDEENGARRVVRRLHLSILP